MSKDIKSLLASRSPSNRIAIAPHNLKQATADKPEEKPVAAVTQPGKPATLTPPQEKTVKKSSQPAKEQQKQPMSCVRYTTYLPPTLVKRVKMFALENNTSDYKVVLDALELFLNSK